MAEVATTDGSAMRRNPLGGRSIDSVISWAFWLLLVAVVLFSLFFGYSVYAQVQSERAADPSLRAIDALKAQVRQDPNNPELRVTLGEAFAASGRRREAIEQLLAAIEIEPEYVSAYLDLALIAMLDKDYASAEGYFQKVLEVTETGEYSEVDQRREQAYYYLGELALVEERFEDAVGYFKTAARIKRDASDTYVRLAQAYLGMEEPNLAFSELEKALAFDPNFAEANFEIARIYLDRDDLVNAAWHFRMAVDNAPEEDRAAQGLTSIGTTEEWLKKASEARDAKDSDGAFDAVRIARSLDPESVDAALLHAQILEDRKKPEDALEVYREVLTLDSGNKAAKDAVARLEPKK